MRHSRLVVLAAAALLGSSCTTDGADTTVPTSYPAASSTTQATVPLLRPTVEAFADAVKKLNTVETTTAAAILNTFATPECGAILGNQPEIVESSKIVAIEQDGRRGTAVLRGVDESNTQTYVWTYDGQTWRFTCQGLVALTTEATAEPAPTVDEQPPQESTAEQVPEYTKCNCPPEWDKDKNGLIDTDAPIG